MCGLFFDFFVGVVIGFECIEAIVVFVITTKGIGFTIVVVVFGGLNIIDIVFDFIEANAPIVFVDESTRERYFVAIVWVAM